MLRSVLLGLGGEGHRGCVCVCVCVCVCESLSGGRLFVTLWATALQALLSMRSKILE